jgi:hypothetical protein
MTLIRAESVGRAAPAFSVDVDQSLPTACDNAPSALTRAPNVEQTIQAWYRAGHSQRAIARELEIDRRKVKRIIDQDL